MQLLQWFPGHMAAAVRMMEENLKLVDGALVVLDARVPHASLNAKLQKLLINKKALYVLNKADLADPSGVKKTLFEFRQEGKSAISVSAMDKRAVDSLYNAIFELLKEKWEKNKQKGVFKPLRIMVVGIPNTGKSTVINAICGGKKAATGDKAGVTRGKQWVRIKELEFLDTPGTMPPSFENQEYAKHLAYVGSMNDDNIDFEDLCFELLKELKEKYPALLKERYGIENEEGVEMMDLIAVKRGMLMKGGVPDYGRCASAVIDDFRKGRIGKVVLD
ncbi:MAG: ribosome biogenesis GTPase YlqF [Clostridia bacterium]|nr:ribosome biogenesis GTPase YlqF [Clostridia bacterium]